MNYVTLAVGEVLLMILTLCSLAAIFPSVRKQETVGASRGEGNLTWQTEFIPASAENVPACL